MSKYLIIGGVAGGATTAARLRRLDENAEIILFEKGGHISYANCGLPYYIGGVITERENLLVQTPESFNARFNIDVRIFSEVTAINTATKSVGVINHADGTEYSETYDKLVLSPGASPIKPQIKGIDDNRIFTLRNVADTDKIKAFVDNNKLGKAAVIGAGFVGLEMAENLHHQGISTTVIEAADQILAPLDFEMAAGIHQNFKAENIGLYLNDPVESFISTDESLGLQLKSGRQIDADIVILSIGVKPDVRLAENAGLAIGPNGGIIVNEYLQTSAEDVYALGDAIEFPNPITGELSLSLLAGPANKQGRILANNLVNGHKHKWKGSINTAIAKVFSQTAASTGVNEKTLKRLGIPYFSTIISAGSHAGYYPGAMPMNLKITFSPEGKLLGAQAVGTDGVDKRIDMLSAVINAGGSIYDLQELEHAYAPPFSSAKDPVNQIGFNAENIIEGFFKPLSFDDLKMRDKGDTVLLDVRTDLEYQLGSLPGAENLDVDLLRSNLHMLPKDKKIYAFCGTGLRSYVASRILKQHGYDVYNLSGGLKIYKDAAADQENQLNSHIEANIKTKVPVMTFEAVKIDACGLQCPGPIIKLKEEIDKIADGEQLEIVSTDAGFYRDVDSWCNVTGNTLIGREQKNGKVTALIRKGAVDGAEGIKTFDNGNNKTIVCFSDDMDRALAAFVIANGAAAMGKKVTLFFTFWGLNIIKNPEKPKVKKDMMGTMFSKMMPSGAQSLKLSNMNMGGMGSWMMKKRMVQKNVDMLDTMISKSLENGVNMIACQMSMEIMGVEKAELIEGVNIGGVANYLEEAEQANLNLFI